MGASFLLWRFLCESENRLGGNTVADYTSLFMRLVRKRRNELEKAGIFSEFQQLRITAKFID